MSKRIRKLAAPLSANRESLAALLAQIAQRIAQQV